METQRLAEMAQSPQTPEGIRLVLTALLEQDERLTELETFVSNSQLSRPSPEGYGELPHPHSVTCPDCAVLRNEGRAEVLAEMDQAASREGLDLERDALANAYDRMLQGIAPPTPAGGLVITDGVA